MEAETIVYYHPVTEQMSAKCAAKGHWWQEAMLKDKILPQDDDRRPFTLVDCPVPPFYYRRKTWKPEKLSEAMETVLHRVPGMTDVCLHPQVMTWLSEMYADRWETCRETREMLLAAVLSEYGASNLRAQGQAAVLLGAPEETEWQMEMTWRLLEPYLSRVNSLAFYYEETEGADIWEELSAHLEMYYYEYGLVPQLTPYRAKGAKKKEHCGRRRCGGLILDYGSAGNFQIPSGRGYGCADAATAGGWKQCIYLDAASCQEKERACAGKSGQILYVSPLKYLDTMVKNSYDRLVP